MARHISVGIDIGTHRVKVLVSEALDRKEMLMPRIIGKGQAESRGIRNGYISNRSEASASIRRAIKQAEKTSGTRIKRAYVSIGGAGLTGVTSTGQTIITRADSEVTDLDIEKVLHVSETNIPKAQIVNRRVIHTVPIQYKIDGAITLGRPEGMKGMKLEVKSLVIACLERHLDELIAAVEEAGVEVEDIVASPIASGLVTLSKVQKIAGSVLANIGSHTVTIVVFENSIPISLEVFPIGSNYITNDIALGLKLSLDDAEKIKKGELEHVDFSQRKIDEIIGARLTDIFELIDGHLKKIGRSGLLPAGIIISGGGASLDGIEDFAKQTLKLPAKAILQIPNLETKESLKNTVWSVAYGLCVIAQSGADEESVGVKIARNTRSNIVRWVKQFLP